MSVVRNRLPALVVALGAILCAGPVFAACQPGPFAVSLPAQRLDERLQELAHVTGCAVEVDPTLLQGKHAVALSGSLTTDQVFVQSVRGSGLEAVPADDHWRVNQAQQLYFAERVETLRSAIADARKSKSITPERAKKLTAYLSKIAVDVPRLVREQGFLSAAERASYGRMLKDVEQSLGRV
ncbi:STN domain-containing protein [Xanthomonas vesicatoria]|uniref:STN domain-containing protein n=1 Tax=Xanthomonas vesicatoria TaxID=56460 RepID=UPI001E5A556F|nr:STN domain-containing protein [Xanthomonas vesicatoria]MCC8618821.1 STN domain-containing protein [Xanthomonas vesicatoria]MCC8630546.1 STN domain-containing protein [Xanthomonas vesicatoria]